MQESLKKIANNVSEIIKDRIFSPMYFYFIFAWIITNWKFIYVLFSVDEDLIFQTRGIFKLEFLKSLYGFGSWDEILLSVSKLFLIPAISAFVAIWWLSKLSEKFYKKNEEHKQNKRIIEREIEYKEKVKLAEMEREIRDAESDKPKIQYEDNEGFNEILDSADNETIEVAGISMRPSRILYENDYDAYKVSFDEWVNDAGEAYMEHLSDIKRGK